MQLRSELGRKHCAPTDKSPDIVGAQALRP
jgi:hypothetical protein